MQQLFVAEATFRNLRVEVTHDAQLVKGLIDEWHSWRCAPQGWRVAFILTDGVVVFGVSTFGRPVARREDQVSTLEHTRMALGPGAPRNSASFFLSRCRRWIRLHMPDVKRLISYVPSKEYSGVTYRSDNWRTVYEGVAKCSSWTNRSGRLSSENEFRTKFERQP